MNEQGVSDFLGLTSPDYNMLGATAKIPIILIYCHKLQCQSPSNNIKDPQPTLQKSTPQNIKIVSLSVLRVLQTHLFGGLCRQNYA